MINNNKNLVNGNLLPTVNQNIKDISEMLDKDEFKEVISKTKARFLRKQLRDAIAEVELVKVPDEATARREATLKKQLVRAEHLKTAQNAGDSLRREAFANRKVRGPGERNSRNGRGVKFGMLPHLQTQDAGSLRDPRNAWKEKSMHRDVKQHSYPNFSRKYDVLPDQPSRRGEPLMVKIEGVGYVPWIKENEEKFSFINPSGQQRTEPLADDTYPFQSKAEFPVFNDRDFYFEVKSVKSLPSYMEARFNGVARSANGKNKLVICNAACQLLARNHKFPLRVYNDLKMKADVWTSYVYNVTPAPSQVTLGHYVAAEAAKIAGVSTPIGVCDSYEDLLDQVVSFEKDKRHLPVVTQLIGACIREPSIEAVSRLNDWFVKRKPQYKVKVKNADDLIRRVARKGNCFYALAQPQVAKEPSFGYWGEFPALPEKPRYQGLFEKNGDVWIASKKKTVWLLDAMSWSALCTNLMEAQSYEGIFSSLYNFLRALSVAPTYIKVFTSMVEGMTSHLLVFQGGGIAGLYNMASDMFEKTDLGQRLMGVMGCFSVVAVVSFLELGGTSEVWRERVTFLSCLLKDVKTGPMENFLQKVLKFIELLVRRCVEVVKTGDLSYLFGSVLPTHSWLKWVRALSCPEIREDPARPTSAALFKKKQALDTYGDMISHQLSDLEYMEQLVKAKAMYESIRLAALGDAEVMKATKAAFEKLGEMIVAEEQRVVNGAPRIEPFGIFVPGPPGVGKTTFISACHKAFGGRLKRSTDPSTVYQVELGTNFPVFNQAQWFASFDDVDLSANALPGQSHFDVVMKLINQNPKNMEAPGLEDKGQLWANFLVATYTTNYKYANLRNLTYQTLAFWRRFKYSVHLTPKPGYCQRGTSIIDQKLVPPAVKDLWSKIEVYKFNAALMSKDQYTSYPFELYKTYNSLVEFSKDFGGVVKEYVDSAVARKVLEANAPCCDICFLDKASHANKEFCSTDSGDNSLSVVNVVSAINNLFDEKPDVTAFLDDQVNLQGLEEPSDVNWYLRFYVLFITCALFHYMKIAVVAKQALLYSQQTSRTLALEVLSLEGFQRFLSLEKKLKLKCWRMMRRFGKIGLSVGVLVGSFAMWSALRHLTKKKINHQSTLEGEDVVAVGNLLPKGGAWAREQYAVARPYITLTKPTWTLDELSVFLVKCMIRIRAHGLKTWAIHYERGFFLVPKHVLCPEGERDVFKKCTMEVWYMTNNYSVPIEEGNSYLFPDRDLALVFMPAVLVVSCLSQRLPPTPQAVENLTSDALTLVNPETSFESEAPLQSTRKFGSRKIQHVMWQYATKMIDGSCGTIGVGTFGNNFAPVSFHVAMIGGHTSFAEDISKSLIGKGIAALEAKLPVEPFQPDWQAALPFLCVNKSEIVPLPPKSSLWVHLSSPLKMQSLVVGTLSGYHTNTFKSKIVDMPFKEKFAALEMKHCGSVNYFQAPNPKGEMRDGVWVDPFTFSMDQNENVSGSPALWQCAVNDYVDGMENLVARDRIRPLTTYEAVIGVPDTDIGSIDLTTSVGPPFNMPKKHFVRVDHVEKTVDFSEGLVYLFKVIDDSLARGLAPSAVCNYVLKDEAVSFEKNQIKKIRVFNVLPYAYNVRLKQHLGPVLIFMRRHQFFFETAAGMNVNSHDWDGMYQFLADFENWSCADRKAFDLKEGSTEWYYTIACLKRMCVILQYTPEEVSITVQLLFGCMYTTRICKGDVFLTNYMMCTGFWATLLINSIRNCLELRYCFYRLRPAPCVENFRAGVRLMTLGDDGASTTKWKWFDQISIARIAREFGAVFTSARKGEELQPFDDPKDVVFLKRNFVRRDGLMLAPIELKTLVKMCTVRLKDTLSEVDHCCQLYSNVLAEAWMHGPEVFAEFHYIISEILVTKAWSSMYLRIFTYEDYVERYRKGVLSVWDPLLNEA